MKIKYKGEIIEVEAEDDECYYFHDLKHFLYKYEVEVIEEDGDDENNKED